MQTSADLKEGFFVLVWHVESKILHIFEHAKCFILFSKIVPRIDFCHEIGKLDRLIDTERILGTLCALINMHLNKLQQTIIQIYSTAAWTNDYFQYLFKLN